MTYAAMIDTATTLTLKLICFVLVLQGLEVFWLARKSSILKIWSYRTLSHDFLSGLPLPSRIIKFLFADTMLERIALAQVGAAVFGFFAPMWIVFAAMFLTHLLICIRFRGSFNGGSDMMTFVILTGALVLTVTSNWNIQLLSLAYIGIHAGYSYFKAGQIKIRSSDWRSGRALPSFLARSVHSETHRLSRWLKSHPTLSLVMCWGVMIFELSILLLLVVPGLWKFYFLVAVVFHVTVYLAFGLNRFFWIWLCAWPAIIYLVA